MRWQVQDAKQRFSELIRTAHDEGPQVVTRHGEEIAVVIDIAEYRHLKGDIAEFKDYLRSGPDFDDLELTRTAEHPRSTEWANEG
jgi:prevent-host-death family protein